MCGFFSYEGKKQELASFDEIFKKLVHRGPDDSEVVEFEGGVVGFHRLAIMDLSHNGDQPFSHAGNILVCNGEVYNYRDLKKMVDYEFQSGSDCEVILPLYEKFGLVETATLLDAEYAFALWDHKKRCFVAARDPIGIRHFLWSS